MTLGYVLVSFDNYCLILNCGCIKVNCYLSVNFVKKLKSRKLTSYNKILLIFCKL